MAILKKGLAGEPVKILQRKLGVPDDGEFGSGTEDALKSYQQANGLTADGIAGPDTFAAMSLYELIQLKTGTSGETVKKLQQALGLPADGQFGAGTEAAVKELQAKNNLAADGIAGPETLAKTTLFKEITPQAVQQSMVAADAGAPAAAAAAGSGGRRSIWDTIKGILG